MVFYVTDHLMILKAVITFLISLYYKNNIFVYNR